LFIIFSGQWSGCCVCYKPGQVAVSATSLAHQHEHNTYTPRRSVRNTLIVG